MVNSQHTATSVRLAEVVGCLSLVTDLATGHPIEHGLRRSMLAVWLGQDLGLSGEELNNAYYVALLGTVCCTLDMAVGLAPIVRDEMALGEKLANLNDMRPLEVAGFFIRHIGEGDPPLRRLRKLASVARTGAAPFQAICRDVAIRVGDMIDIGPAVRQVLGQCHERWDGKGWPQRLKGEEVDIGARLFHVAHDAEVFNRLGGIDAVLTVMQQRSGKLYDPHIAGRFRELARHLLSRLESEATWDAALSAEPSPLRWLSEEDLDNMTQAVANFVDVRSLYTLGHSTGVAAIAEAAARGLGLSDTEASAVRQAGLLHDLGRAGVPVTVWDKTSPLTEMEWERVKRHPSLTELVLARSSALGHLGTLAGLHHERLDGSGYRGVPASFLPVAAQD
jgi:HD-GYP domain-containing protein (c-di-GMP phosphodiesterase class II)